MSNSVAVSKQYIHGLLTAMKPDFEALLGGKERANKLVAAVYMETRKNDRLMSAAKANPQSLFEAMLACAELKLNPGSALGHVYLIPFGDQIQVLPGYRGWIEVARRTGKISSIQVDAVYEGDLFDYEYGTNPFLSHKPVAEDRSDAKLTHVYCVTRYMDGGYEFKVLDKKRIAYHQKHSNAKKSPWQTHWAEMAKKSAIQEARKTWPMIEQLERLEELEVKTEVAGVSLLDAGSAPTEAADGGRKGKAKSLDDVAERIESRQAQAAQPAREPGDDPVEEAEIA